MSQEQRQEAPKSTEPCPKDPAPQPSNPDPDCKPLDAGNIPPCYEPPKACEPCCECPSTSGDPPTCFETLIKDEADSISKGEQAKKFKADLEALMAKVKAATLEYTQDAYDDLLERWKKEDDAIVCLIHSIDCALPCWKCVIECELCPLINDIVRIESKLSGEAKTCPKDKPDAESSEQTTAQTETSDGTPAEKPECDPSKTVTSVYDIRQWWWRERLRRQALFDQVTAVMKAWETPYKTLDAVLKANAEIMKNASAMLGVDQRKDAAKLLFDVFFRLVPTHLAIAPPGADGTTTAIDKMYTEFCCCDNSPPLHSCCGVIIRLPTVLDRIIGPQPFLIKPGSYAGLVCCLAKNVFQPAKQQTAEADSKYAEYDTEAKAAEAAIAAQLKSLAADAKVRLAKTIDCKDYSPKDAGSGSTHKCCGGEETPPQQNGNRQPNPAQTGNPAQNTSR